MQPIQDFISVTKAKGQLLELLRKNEKTPTTRLQ